MRNVSNAFRQMLFQNKRKYNCTLEITLSDGTKLTITNDNIMNSGIDIDDAVGDDGDFTALGSTVIRGCTVTLYNNTINYSDYNFKNAKVVVKVNLVGADDSDELQLGVFTVDEPTYGDYTITLSMLDNMCQFDRPYNSYGIYTNSTTLRSIVYDACSKCGVLYDSSMSSFPNYNFVVPDAPKDDCTYREVIGWCATIAGCFAHMTDDGKLKFDWFNVDAFDTEEANGTDGGEFDSANPYATGDTLNGGTFSPWNDPSTKDGGAFTDKNYIHYIYGLSTQNIGTDDVVITGIRVTYDIESDGSNTTETQLIGTDDYVIDISDNPFITADNYNDVLTFLQPILIGLQFRTCNVTQPNDPTIQAGDVAYIWDTKGIQHRTLITRATFNPTTLQTIVCGAKTPEHNSATRLSAITKAIVKSRRQLNEEKSIRELIEADFQRQIANGSGLYFTRVIAGTSEIIYGHDKPLLADSKVVFKMSTGGFAMTGDYRGTDADTSAANAWYGFSFDGTWIANIISTMNLFFDYAHGGTLTLGGDDNENGLLQVYDSTGNNLLVSLGEDGIIANSGGKLTSKNGKVYVDLDNDEIACSMLKSPDGTIILDGKGTNSFRMYNEGSETYAIQFIPTRGTNAAAQIKTIAGLMLYGYGTNSYFHLDQTSIKLFTFQYGSTTSRFGIQLLASSYGNNVYITGDTVYLPSTIYAGNTKIYPASSSSIRYKHNIKPLSSDRDAHKLLELPIVEFEWNDDHPLQYKDMAGQTIPGIIAEDVEEIYPSAVIHNNDGEVESWDERRLIPGMLALIQEQQNRIADLESRLEKLEHVIIDLTNDGR